MVDPVEYVPKAVVIGDICLDETTIGQPTRMSPEAPHVVVMEEIDTVYNVGMAANVASNIQAQGVQTTLIASGGFDGWCGEIRDQVRSRGVVPMIAQAMTRTSVKKRLVNRTGDLVARVDAEIRDPLFRPGDTGRAMREFDEYFPEWREAIAEADIVVVSDYDKGFLHPMVLRQLFGEIHKKDTLVLMDPKKFTIAAELNHMHAIMKPNIAELNELYRGCCDKLQRDEYTDLEVNSPAEQVIEVASFVRDYLKITGMLVTRGSNGLLYVNEQTHRELKPAEEAVFDVIGAGDTIIATMAASIAKRRSAAAAVESFDQVIKQAMDDALIAGSLSVKKHGAAVISAQQIDEKRGLCKHPSAMFTRHKRYYRLEHLLGAVEEARSRGKRVVLTNGCFDLLHPGHIYSLQSSANRTEILNNMADTFLVVAIDSDRRVAELKGEGRPIHSCDHRVEALAALGCVDAVIVFDSFSELTEIAVELTPDVYTKSEQYQGKEDADHLKLVKQIKRFGGKVRYTPHLAKFSTTKIVERIQSEKTE